ncbi:MAG: trifunctional transcriptional activator/DNA repair protein Ada/methylated-DNA--[protein]-cysteine S-methyltransferase [Cohaesibacter sp.]|nr:trifunctional transcriptional activator/DNA repair protein Ada/methylated-DNA--[protein]-cysteine S-methyltransferase [Cohaesibacter sp.]
MLIHLPNDQILYQALLERDPEFEGRAYVCVSSTGIFCRLTCPARKPKFKNCSFQETIAACLEAGFRPCKRCHPMQTAAEADPAVQSLLAALEQSPQHRWSEADIVSAGFDPSTIRRSFKRHFGITFLEMARQTRIREGFETLAIGGKVIEAQLDAGFASPSAFRAAFGKLLGMAPSHFQQDALLRADWIDTPLGAMIAVSDASSLHLLEFLERKALPRELKALHKRAKGSLGFGRFSPTDQVQKELDAYFKGDVASFKTPITMHGSAFTQQVWRQLRSIPVGQTRSYSQLAKELDNPAATRAVARANGANPLAILVPCHRVIASDGNLTGYGGGLWRKQKLIDLEQKIARKAGSL